MDQHQPVDFPTLIPTGADLLAFLDAHKASITWGPRGAQNTVEFHEGAWVAMQFRDIDIPLKERHPTLREALVRLVEKQ